MNQKRQGRRKSPQKSHSNRGDTKNGSPIPRKGEAGLILSVPYPKSDSRRESFYQSDEKKTQPKNAVLKKILRRPTGEPPRQKSVKRQSLKVRESVKKSDPLPSIGSTPKPVRKKSKKKPFEVGQKETSNRKISAANTSTEEKRRRSKAASVLRPNLEGIIKMEMIPSDGKDFLIDEAVRGCFVCDSSAGFYHEGFFCDDCIQKFEYTVNKASSITCPNDGKCRRKQNCEFCLAETFYLHGINATNVVGFQRVARGYSLVNEIPEYPPELQVEETQFCLFFNSSLNGILDWFMEQGDILKLTPNDRKLLVDMNSGRARLLWLVADLIPRHNVIRTTESYLSIMGFSSETLLKTFIDVNDIAKYFISLSFTPQHMYFVKLLSMFQIGKCAPCSFAKSLHSECRCGEEKFERGSDIKLMSENYRMLLRQMSIKEGDIQQICSFIDLLTFMNEVATGEECIEVIEICISRWIAKHPEWRKYENDILPKPIEKYSTEVHNLSYYLNGVAIQTVRCASNYLRAYFSFRDKRTLLYHNAMALLVISVCWNLEPIFGEKDEDITDCTLQVIWSELRALESYLNSGLRVYISLQDCQVMFLIRYQHEDTLKDINMREFEIHTRKKIFTAAEKKLMQKFPTAEEQDDHIKMLRISSYEIFQKVDKVIETLESMRSNLPLFINLRSWIMEM